MPRKARIVSTKPSKAAKTRAPKTASAAVIQEAQPTSKIGTLIALLRRAEGAALAELIKVTGWQAHSVRGAIAGTIKKKHGLKIASVRGQDGARRYRVEP